MFNRLVLGSFHCSPLREALRGLSIFDFVPRASPSCWSWKLYVLDGRTPYPFTSDLTPSYLRTTLAHKAYQHDNNMHMHHDWSMHMRHSRITRKWHAVDYVYWPCPRTSVNGRCQFLGSNRTNGSSDTLRPKCARIRSSAILA